MAHTETSSCSHTGMLSAPPFPQYLHPPLPLCAAALRIADGSFVEPTNELNEVAVAELAALAAVSPEDWSFLDARSPARYPVAYWVGTLASRGREGWGLPPAHLACLSITTDPLT